MARRPVNNTAPSNLQVDPDAHFARICSLARPFGPRACLGVRSAEVRDVRGSAKRLCIDSVLLEHFGLLLGFYRAQAQLLVGWGKWRGVLSNHLFGLVSLFEIARKFEVRNLIIDINYVAFIVVPYY